YYPEENCSGQIQADTLSDDPEIDANTLKMAAFYPQSLGVPQRRNTTDPTIINGKNLFMQLKCDNCHHPKYITGQHPEYAFLSNQKIYPYSDFLLHDMGDALADNRPDFEANGKEWRTPPLWGLGLTKTVGGPNANFLHDGRAKNLQEAIMWHGGEAENSKESFRKLNKAERESVINFLESL
ncbi:MAG TPA: di-heme oxidoredictase family protein, partial [Chitinophagales bacterium]|nr:di-heme oxidoredictase family protein [Chitinophagales bacterium]